MKKKYMKPMIAVESFQLDAAIAASCATPINFNPNGGCNSAGSTGEELKFFGLGCEPNVMDGDYEDSYCYHGPVGNALDIFLQS